MEAALAADHVLRNAELRREIVAEQHRRQQERQVGDGKPHRLHRSNQPFLGKVLGRSCKATYRCTDEQILDKHYPSGYGHKHQ